jgi:Tfp pilus assembly protein PilF
MSTERGSLLFQTGRYDLADQEFRQALLADPQDARAHAMLGLCLVKRLKFRDATAEAEQAIQLRPDWDFGYHALAVIFFERNRMSEAAAAITEALRLDPWNPDHHGLLAHIRMQQRDWAGALAEADKGLQSNPQHSDCINARGMALTKLGQRGAAAATIDQALAKDPENALSHANRGWALLHENNPKQAMEHFREALRLKPEMDWAKAGMVEALKARNPIYRMMLKYFLAMAKLNRRAQWGVLVAGYIGIQILSSIADAHPAQAVWIKPVTYVYIAFVVMTWLSYPLFNLMLRLDRFGKYALSRDQIFAANCVGACLFTALAMLLAALVLHSSVFLALAAITGVLVLPVAAIFTTPIGWPRWAMVGYTGLIVLVAIMLIVTMFAPAALPIGPAGSRDNLVGNLIEIFGFGAALSSWVANALAMAQVRR